MMLVKDVCSFQNDPVFNDRVVRSCQMWKAHRAHPSKHNPRSHFQRSYLHSVWIISWKLFPNSRVLEKHDEDWVICVCCFESYFKKPFLISTIICGLGETSQNVVCGRIRSMVDASVVITIEDPVDESVKMDTSWDGGMNEPKSSIHRWKRIPECCHAPLTTNWMLILQWNAFGSILKLQ